MARWVDLSSYGLRVVIGRAASGNILVLLGDVDRVARREAEQLRFKRTPNGLWVRPEMPLQAAEVRAVFPRATIREMPAERFILADRQSVERVGDPAEYRQEQRRVSETPATPASDVPRPRVSVALAQNRLIGRNRLGQAVYEDVSGRYATDGERVRREHEPSPLFLRMREPSDLQACAEGLVLDMAAGLRMDTRSFRRWLADVAGRPIEGDGDELARPAQEALEAAMVAHMARTGADQAPEEVFAGALALYERQPIFRARDSDQIALQQFSTPLPMSSIAQRVLGTTEELRGSTVLEPTIGHCALVSGLQGASIYGFDLDPARPRRLMPTISAVNRLVIAEGDAVSVEFPKVQYVIANPPFGGLPAPVDFKGLRILRLDHLIMMRALAARDPDGRMVAIIAGDSPRKFEAGQVAPGSKRLFMWLADHYDVESIVEADGGLYSRQGAQYPVRIVVIGQQRPQPLAMGAGLEVCNIGDTVPVIDNYADLWGWSENVLARRTETLERDGQRPATGIAGEYEWVRLVGDSVWAVSALRDGEIEFSGVADTSQKIICSESAFQKSIAGGRLSVEIGGEIKELRFDAAAFQAAQAEEARRQTHLVAAALGYPEAVSQAVQWLRKSGAANIDDAEIARLAVGAVATGQYVCLFNPQGHFGRADTEAVQRAREAAVALLADMTGTPLPETFDKTFFNGEPLPVAPHWQEGFGYDSLTTGPDAPAPEADPKTETLPTAERFSRASSDGNRPQGDRPRENRNAGRQKPEAVAETALPSVIPPALPAPAPLRASGERVSMIENSYQAPYQPHSKLGEATAMIPLNLAAPTYGALDRLEEAVGPVDQYVAGYLDWTPEQLAGYLSPEQIDFMALKFYAEKHLERGIITADQTGLGKGRLLAAMTRHTLLNNRPVIFMTEKANLFSDLVRDLRDIGSADLIRPLILNAGTDIYDTISGTILIKRNLQEIVEDSLRSLRLPPGTNMVFCTYSQFSRGGRKALWLPSVADGAHLILDESHVATGESALADVIASAARVAAVTDYSSATYAKGARNMRAYSRIFPPEISADQLAEQLDAGGELLQEILSAMLAEDGVLVRREHDLSRLEFCSLTDVDRLDRNRAYSDALAPILAGMAYLGGDIDTIVKSVNKRFAAEAKAMPEEDRKGNRMRASSMEFGSRLYNITRLFALALKIDFVVERAAAALERGEKPVLVVENTMETLLRDVLGDSDAEFDEDTVNDKAPIATGITLEFRDVLRRVLTGLGSITLQNGYGRVERRKVEHPKTLSAMARLHEMIEAFPDLPVSPLDTIREELGRRGYICDELSGRSLCLDAGRVQLRTQESRTTITSRFNNGGSDAIIITRTGSTGISLHASPRFADQRRRRLIELQIANNVAERMQFWGRVNRKDQVSDPAIETISTGLPGEARLLAMQNAKLRKLSANTTSNRSNSAEDKNVADIFNSVGEDVVRELLMKFPELVQQLALPELGKADARGGSTFYVDKVMSRMLLLSSDQQEEIYQQIMMLYDAKIADYEAKGINPFKARELEGVWSIEHRELLDGDESSTSAFNRPTYLVRLVGTRFADPLRSETVRQMQERNRENLLLGRNRSTVRDILHDRALALRERMPTLLARYEKPDMPWQEMLNAEGANTVKTMAETYTAIGQALVNLDIGGFIGLEGEDGHQRGIIVDVKVPPEGKEHLSGDWRISYVVPGNERRTDVTLASLIKGGALFDPQPASLKPFDEAQGGQIRTERLGISGNLFRAAEIALHTTFQAGKPVRLGAAATYRDEHGLAHRIVLVHKDLRAEHVLKIPVPVTVDLAVRYLQDKAVGNKVRIVSTNPKEIEMDGNNSPVFIGLGDDDVTIRAGASGTAKERSHGVEAITDITGPWRGNRVTMSVDVGIDTARRVMEKMGESGQRMFLPADERDWVMAQRAQDRPHDAEKAVDHVDPAEQRLLEA